MLKRLLRHPNTLALGTRAVAGYLALCYRTTRWTLIGAEHVADHVRSGRPIVVAFWHERLPVMPMLWHAAKRVFPETAGDGRGVRVLVSRHRDGRLIGDVVGRFDLGLVHGSSSKGGATALAALARAVEAGDYAAITPDGPRGPRRVAAPGVAQLAALSGAPVVPCAGATTRRRVLGTWDRMHLPMPFARGCVVVLPPIHLPRDADPDAALPAIAAAITAATDAADAWAARGGPPGEGVRV